MPGLTSSSGAEPLGGFDDLARLSEHTKARRRGSLTLAIIAAGISLDFANDRSPFIYCWQHRTACRLLLPPKHRMLDIVAASYKILAFKIISAIV